MTAPQAAELLGLQLRTFHAWSSGASSPPIVEPDAARRRRHIAVARTPSSITSPGAGQAGQLRHLYEA